MVYVEEMHGGTSGTDYIYFIKNREVVHVSQLPRVTKVKVERWGRNRKLVVWSVPDEEVAGNEGLCISFSSRGRYPYIRYFRLPQEVSGLQISVGELFKRNLIDEGVKDPIKDIVQKRGLVFRLFGPEREQLKQYREIVPKLVNDLWNVLRSVGINDVFISEHSERLGETLRNPVYAEYMSMVLPTPQGRIRSLHEKITRTFEVWLLSNIVKALRNLGAQLESNTLWISFTTNTPAIKMRYRDKLIYVLYQPSLVPHIISGFISLPKPFHAIPDIAIMVLNKEEYIDWGGLSKYSDKIPLIVEAKLSLTGITRYEAIDTVINQVNVYKKLLNDKPTVIVPIYRENRSAVYKLNTIPKVKALDGVNPDNPMKVNEFIRYVEEVIRAKL